MKKKRKSGAGRKLKYAEPTCVYSVRVPKTHRDIIEGIVMSYLLKFIK